MSAKEVVLDVTLQSLYFSRTVAHSGPAELKSADRLRSPVAAVLVEFPAAFVAADPVLPL